MKICAFFSLYPASHLISIFSLLAAFIILTCSLRSTSHSFPLPISALPSPTILWSFFFFAFFSTSSLPNPTPLLSFLTILHCPFSIRHCVRPRPGVGHRHSGGWWFHPPRHPHPLPPDHWKVRALHYPQFKFMQRECHSVCCYFSMLCGLV